MQGASRDALATARADLTALAGGLPDPAALAGVAGGLFSVVRLLDGAGHLRRALGDPTTPPEAKDALLTSLLGAQLDPVALRVLTGAVAQRWSSARDLVDAVEVLAATAVFLVAEAEGALDRVEEELFRFARVVAGDPRLRAVLTDRSLDPGRKRALLDGLLADRAHPLTREVVAALVLAPRGRTLEDGLAEFAALAADVRARTMATVTSAVPLDEEQARRLADALSAQLGRTVSLQTEVDPAVVGGVVVHIGDEVIDASTAHRLAQARRRLAG